MANGYVGIPMSYTPVEYIESTGTQYIDTETVFNNVKVEIKFAATSSSQTDAGLVGAYKSGVGSILFGFNANLFRVAYGGPWNGNTLSLDTGVHIAKINIDNKCTIDSTTLATSSNITTSLNTGVRGYLFASNGGAGRSSARMYYCKIWDSNNTLVKDFIPVLDGNGIACLYEQVGGNFYYNAGTGTFTAGTAGQPVSVGDRARKIVAGYVGIPTSYTPVEYIESTGSQYIDTGIVPTSTTKLEFDANIVSGDSNVWMPVYGSRSFNSTATYFCLYIQTSSHHLSPNYAGFDPGTSGNTTINLNQRYKLTEDKGQFYIDDVLKSGISTTNTLTTGDKPIYLFANNSNGDVQMRGQDVKLYGCKIWNNNILVRDFIAVQDDNSVPCLYDLVEGKFYYNKGPGTFVAGSTTGQPVSLGDKARKIIKGYVGINGVARLMWRGHMYSSLRSFTRNSPSKYEAYVTSTQDYVLVGAGYESSAGTTNAKVKAYDINCIETSCTDLPATARRGMTMRCGGYGIMASGNYTSSQSSVRTNCTAYDNNLTRTQMSAVTTGVYRAQTAGNDTHCILEGGTNYNAFQTACQSYNSSLVKSSLSSDQQRLARGASNIGNYILLVGARGSSTSVSIYDNSNVKTTTSNPYSKVSDGVLGVSTDKYAMFFGGNTNNSTNISISYSDIVAYDKNLVKVTSSLPSASSGLQGFTFDTNYALVLTGAEGLIYDNNLQIQERFSVLTTKDFFSLAESNSTFGLVLSNGLLATTQIIF